MVTILIVIVIQVLGLFILYQLGKRWIARKLSPDELTRRLQEELQSIMVELNRITEQNIGLMEEKISELQELLSQADKKISLLKREAHKHEVGKAVYTQLRKSSRDTGDAEAGRGAARARGAERGIQEDVLKLHHEGFSAAVIATHLGTTIGEVELIISLEEGKGK